jgi:hypothetical protein
MMVEMKKLVLGIMLVGIVLLGLGHVAADADTPNNEVTSSTSNSSASITITMYAMPDE